VNAARVARGVCAALAITVGAAALGACSGDDGPAPRTSTTAPATSATTATTTPPSTAAPRPPETVAARQRLFGAEHVDANGAIREPGILVSWFGVSSLAASLAGHVVLLDTYVNGDPPTTCSSSSPPADTAALSYAPVSYDELVALQPEAIFIGHGHYDHDCLAGVIAARTGAVVVALPQECDHLAQQVSDAGITDPLRCEPPLAADSPVGATAAIEPLGPDVPVTVVRNLHSGGQTSGGAEALAYVIHADGRTILWNDTTGPASAQAPDLLAALRTLGPVDAAFSASFGTDAVDYVEAVGATVLYPVHHDFLGSGPNPDASAGLRPAVEAALRARPGISTELRWQQDPGDYLRPIVVGAP